MALYREVDVDINVAVLPVTGLRDVNVTVEKPAGMALINMSVKITLN